MDIPKKSSASRSSSRSKRSQVNLADLRLSPLTTRITESRHEDNAPKSSGEDYPDLSFTQSHPSYLQGKSAPTTPGILSRSSSRRHLGGGLSRRGSIYENDGQVGMNCEYAGVVQDGDSGLRVEVGSGQIPKAKSEAALLVQRNILASQGVRWKKQKQQQQQQQQHARSRTGGSNTPRVKIQTKAKEVEDDDWLTRTGAATNALLQESKGQSWIASRESSTSLTHLQDTTDEEDDEGYEEMAALSARGGKREGADEELSPVSTRVSRWGSRYGSRTGSRQTSRRGSLTLTTGSRTPLTLPGGHDGVGEYFDVDSPAVQAMEPNFVDAEEESESHDEAAVARLTESRSFGLGNLVDRLMNFNLFKVEEKEESTEDESNEFGESEREATERRDAENKRKREEKEKLVKLPASTEGEDGADRGEGGWSDAAWLFGVASKAIF